MYAVFRVVPFGVCVVDPDERWDLGGGRISICVVRVGLKNGETESGGERKEQAHTGLFDAGGIGLGGSAESRGGAIGSVAAIPGFPSAVRLDAICPVLSEDE